MEAAAGDLPRPLTATPREVTQATAALMVEVEAATLRTTAPLEVQTEYLGQLIPAVVAAENQYAKVILSHPALAGLVV